MDQPPQQPQALVPTQQPQLLIQGGPDARHAEAFLQVMMMPGSSRESVLAMMALFQVDACMQSVLRLRTAAAQKRRLMGQAGPDPLRAELYNVRDLLTFQQDPLPTSMLRIDRSLQEASVQLFCEGLRFMGLEDGRPLTKDEERLVVSRVFSLLGKHPSLRNECAVQLQKQTRANPYKAACLKAWELFRLCVCVFPPTPQVAGPLSAYFEALVAEEAQLGVDLKEAVLATWTALDHALKAGPRRTIPSNDEIVGLLNRRPLIAPVFLCDDWRENVPYDATTTLGESIQALMKKMQVSESTSFALYTYRITPHAGATPGEPTVDEILLDSSQYLGDVLADFARMLRNSKVLCKLILKKRFFAPSDAAVSERMFLRLCYIQLRQDYITSHYVVTEEGAVVLAALQIAAEIGMVPDPETSLEWDVQMKKAIPKVLWRLRQKEEWAELIVEQYRGMWSLDNEATMREFVRIILGMPHGGSCFYLLRVVEDTARYFPNHIVLGVNRNGLHFLDAEVRSIIHSAELKDVAEYAGNPDRLFLEMNLRGSLHTFEFITTGGEEICLSLDHYINEAFKAMQVV